LVPVEDGQVFQSAGFEAEMGEADEHGEKSNFGS
jgi:hypothetical protein